MIDVERFHAEKIKTDTNFDLFDETLTGSSANDLIASVLGATVNHHKLENIRSIIGSDRASEGASDSINRIDALRRALQKELSAASAGGKQIRLKCELKVEVVDDSPRHRS